MKSKNIGNILQDYFNAQQSNFIQHLQNQENNFQEHFQMLEDLFSNNDTNKISQKLKTQKTALESNIENENKNFKKKVDQQKRKTNNLLSGTNVYIPDDTNSNANRIRNNIPNRRNVARGRSYNNRNSMKEVDKKLEFKKMKAISALPCFQYKYIIKYEKRNEKNCSICLIDFKEDDTLIRFSCKEHIFHKNCILTWLEKSDKCPLCKKSLIY